MFDTSWLVVLTIFLFFHLLGIIIPTDFHILKRGVGIPPTSKDKTHVCIQDTSSCMYGSDLIR